MDGAWIVLRENTDYGCLWNKNELVETPINRLLEEE